MRNDKSPLQPVAALLFSAVPPHSGHHPHCKLETYRGIAGGGICAQLMTKRHAGIQSSGFLASGRAVDGEEEEEEWRPRVQFKWDSLVRSPRTDEGQSINTINSVYTGA